MFDKRLIGTWKSDKARTLAHYTFRKGVTSRTKKRFGKLFGKLTKIYTRTQWTSFLKKTDECAGRYRVLAKDKHSVAIWIEDGAYKNPATAAKAAQAEKDYPHLFSTGRNISHIQFEDEDHYWITVRLLPGLREYFRRVKPKKTRS